MKKHVLVVDDSDIVLAKASEALSAKGDEVYTALSAAAADRYIYGDPRPDLIIMDVMMPLLDGDQKVRILKADRATRDIPILLMSSKAEEELARLTSLSGADGYIRKPFTFRDLIAMVERISALS
jgi:CheY-like chemotaxis protein